MTPFLVALGAVACAALAGRRLPPGLSARLDVTRYLEGRAAPWVVGVITSLLCAWVWGHLLPTPIIHDEASYLLQARIFARGAFAMPARPLPEFFEQFHVYVTPVFASKYPPGHPLLLAVGVLLGWPPLVPLLLDGLTGALIFMLARRIANPWVGLFTWLVWITPRATFHHIASYFSQSTSMALWMLGWWALLSWRDTGRRRWLVTISACVSWLAITRPVTALAYALPLGVVVLVLVARRRAWRDLGIAIAVGCAVLSVLPYANARVSGSWRVVPLSQYSTIYFPFDKPGFGLDSSPPKRELPPDMVEFTNFFRPSHVWYGPPVFGRAVTLRFFYTALDLWRGPRAVLALTALAAGPLLGAELVFGLASMATLFLFYLSFSHGPDWTIYYAEIMPVLAMLSALGLWRLCVGLRRIRSDGGIRAPQHRAAIAIAALVIVTLPVMVRDWSLARDQSIGMQAYQRTIFSAFDAIPERRAIVFIRYGPSHVFHWSLIANDPDLESAHVWQVYDRGPDNSRLRRLAPERTAYLYDDESGRLSRLPSLATRPTASAQ